MKARIGRASKYSDRIAVYSDRIAVRICDATVEGRTMREISGTDGTPNAATVFRWLNDDRYRDFHEQSARAKEAQAGLLADELLQMADDRAKDHVQLPRGAMGSKFDQ